MDDSTEIFSESKVRRPSLVSTFVSVGNATQPFPRLLDAVFEIEHHLPQPVVVQHGRTPFSHSDCIAMPFVELGEFERFIAQAELLIMHAGAGSVIHAVRAGKIPVVMPRSIKFGEHVDDHQLAFARSLAQTGRVVLAEQTDDLEEAVKAALARQQSRSTFTETVAMMRLVSEVLANYAKTRY